MAVVNTRNLHRMLKRGEWAGPGPAGPDGELSVQLASVGEPDGVWYPVLGLRYDPVGPGHEPAVDLWVHRSALDPRWLAQVRGDSDVSQQR